MKAIKMMWLVILGGLVMAGCSPKIVLCDRPEEISRVRNNGWEYERNKEPQIIPIGSKPSGATVFIDGKELGKTPFTLSLKRGNFEYEVELVKEGYRKEKVIIKGRLYKWTALFNPDSSPGWFYQYQPEGIDVTLTPE